MESWPEEGSPNETLSEVFNTAKHQNDWSGKWFEREELNIQSPSLSILYHCQYTKWHQWASQKPKPWWALVSGKRPTQLQWARENLPFTSHANSVMTNFPPVSQSNNQTEAKGHQIRPVHSAIVETCFLTHVCLVTCPLELSVHLKRHSDFLLSMLVLEG